MSNIPLLTTRQMELLIYVARGLTSKQIGNRLHISHRTVESHISTLKDKLSCLTKSSLIEHAWKTQQIRDRLFQVD